MKCILLLSLGLICAVNVRAVNTGGTEDSTASPMQPDPCGGSRNNSLGYSLRFGGVPFENGLGEGILLFEKSNPSPAIYTPQVLAYRCTSAIRIDEIFSGSPKTRYRIGGLAESAVVFYVNDGESIGAPGGTAIGRDERIVLLDSNYQPAPAGAAKKPDLLRILYPDGGFLELSIATKEAVRYRSASGRVTVFSEIPAELATKVIKVDGVLRQIKAAEGLADIVTAGATAFEVRLYATGSVGQVDLSSGLYTTSAKPYRTIRFEKEADSSADLNRLKITDTWGARMSVDRFVYDYQIKEWLLTQGEGAASRSESKMLASPGDMLDQTYRRTLCDSTGRVASSSSETKRNMPWGAVTIREVSDPDGFRLTTTYNYDYHTTGEPGYGKVRQKIDPDGYWEEYQYDAQNRVVVKRTPYLDSRPGDVSNLIRTTFSYSALDPADQPTLGDARPRTRTVEVVIDGNATIVERSYDVYYTDDQGRHTHIAERAVRNTAAYGDSDNLRTVEVSYTGDSARADYDEVSAGKISYIDSADGVRDSCTYTRDRSDSTYYLTCSTVHATSEQPTGVDGLSTRIDTTYDVRGNLVRTRYFIRAGGSWILGSEELRVYDDQGLHLSTSCDGRVTYSATYIGDRHATETGEDGVVASFSYDALGRIETETRQGAPATGAFAAQADIDTIYIRELGSTNCNCDGAVRALTSADALITETVSRNDAVGRISYKKDAAGLETNYVYAFDGRQTTRINPDLGTVVISSYVDRRMKSVTGSGTDAHFTRYGVNPDGSQWTEVRKGSETGERWERTTKDMLGRTVQLERPAFDGGVLLTRMSYDAQGRLFRTRMVHVSNGTENALSADTLVYYDALGNVARSGMDIDGDGALAPASADRITDSVTTYAQYESAWWLVRRTLGYPLANNASAVQISESRQRVSGFVGTLASETVALDLYGNVARQRTDIDLAARTVTQTSTSPASNLSAVSISYNGRNVSQTSTTVGAATALGYDALGRLVSIKDPRQVHPATVVYDSVTGQIAAKTDGAGNATRYEYYPTGVAGAGRPSKISDPLSKTQRMAYDLQGRVLFQWGTAAYPQAWNYNETGELISSTTWRAVGAVNLDSVTWPAPSGGDTTVSVFQDSTGLLTRRQMPDGQGTDYIYDVANRLSVRTWARAVAGTRVTTTYGYDPSTGEMLATLYSDGTPGLTFTYDRLGRQATVGDVTGTRSFGYSPTTLRLETETLPASYFGGRIITRDYEVSGTGSIPGRSAGYRLGVAGAAGQDLSIIYAYDAQGRFSKVSSSAGLFTYGFVPNSDLLSGVAGPKISTTYVYDPDRDQRILVTNSVGAVTVSRFDYGLDAAGKRISRVQDGSAFTATSYDRFGYNDRGEITASRNYVGNDPANYLSDTQSAALARFFDYDAIGNRLAGTEGSASACAYTSNALNQYSAIAGLATSPTYDRDGNQASNGAGWYFDWDAENRLVRARNYSVSPASGSLKVEFDYDYQGRRIRRAASIYGGTAWTPSDDRKFIYDGWNVVAELNGTASQLLTTFTWGLDLSQSLAGAGGVGGLLAVTSTSPTTQSYFATYDGNGNVSEYINGTGGIEAHFAYDAFGQTTATSGSNLGRFGFRFSTKYVEEAAGLYYYGYRYYSTALGRWLSRDPLGEKGGENLYAMVRNSTVGTADYLGLIDCYQLRQAQIAAELAQLLRNPNADPQRLMQLFEQLNNGGHDPDSGGLNFGGGAAGTFLALNGGTPVSLNGRMFTFSLQPPAGSWTPAGGSTSNLFFSDPLKPNIGLRLDYGYNVATGTSNWHWNQKGVSSVFGVSNHATAGAAEIGSLVNTLKWGGRALVVGGVVVSGVEIATSPHPVYETGRQASGWAGAMALGALGAKGGAAGGAAVGVWFGGVGAAPGAAIGGFLGGLGGGVVGWFGGTKTYEGIAGDPGP